MSNHDDSLLFLRSNRVRRLIGAASAYLYWEGQGQLDKADIIERHFSGVTFEYLCDVLAEGPGRFPSEL